MATIMPSLAQTFQGGLSDVTGLAGAGTVNYQLTTGQSNNFNVGATTSIGVSSNVSSTEAYSATAGGNLALGNGGGYDVQYNGAGSGAGSWDFNGGTWSGGASGAGAGAVTVGWNGGSTAILQSIGNSAGADAGAGSFDTSSQSQATATAGIGVVAGTFNNDPNGGASAIVSGIANKSNVFLGEGSTVVTEISSTGTATPGTSQTGSASSNSSVATTANAATTSSEFSSGFINVLGNVFGAP